jgi:hypothetical protein
MSRKPKPKPEPPRRDDDLRRWHELPQVPEAQPEDVASGKDARYLDRAELRRRLIEAGA